MIINRANLSALFPGYNLIFNQAFHDTPTDWERVGTLVPSNTSKETYPWLGLTTRFREWLGDRHIQNLKTHDFTIANISYENTVAVDRNHIEDDTYGVYRPMVAQLGQDAKTHPDELIFQLIRDGFTKLCYDGQFFFDTDHPVVQADGTTASVSNHGGGAGTAWFLLDTSKFIKPFIFQKRKDYDLQSIDKANDEHVFMRREYIYGVDARVNVGYALW